MDWIMYMDSYWEVLKNSFIIWKSAPNYNNKGFKIWWKLTFFYLAPRMYFDIDRKLIFFTQILPISATFHQISSNYILTFTHILPILATLLLNVIKFNEMLSTLHFCLMPTFRNLIIIISVKCTDLKRTH